MTGKLKLDDVDRQILRDLQDYGRMTNVELAKRAGISAPHVCRVRALEETGGAGIPRRFGRRGAWL